MPKPNGDFSVVRIHKTMKERLRILAKTERRSMAAEIDFLVDRECVVKGLARSSGKH